jgi:hypothetical protein
VQRDYIELVKYGGVAVTQMNELEFENRCLKDVQSRVVGMRDLQGRPERKVSLPSPRGGITATNCRSMLPISIDQLYSDRGLAQ